MRRAKAAVRRRRPDALARVRRDAVSALQAWQQELENQLALVQRQIAALRGPAAAPTAPRRRRRARKPARRKAAAKAVRKTRRKVARKKAARKAPRKAKRKAARKPARKAAAKARKRARRKVTMAQAIVQLLKDKGRPLRPVEITNFIRSERRYKTKSKNLYNAVMTNLIRTKEVKKNRKGQYQLA